MYTYLFFTPTYSDMINIFLYYRSFVYFYEAM